MEETFRHLMSAVIRDIDWLDKLAAWKRVPAPHEWWLTQG